jgi:hypothetical protein
MVLLTLHSRKCNAKVTEIRLGITWESIGIKEWEEEIKTEGNFPGDGCVS